MTPARLEDIRRACQQAKYRLPPNALPSPLLMANIELLAYVDRLHRIAEVASRICGDHVAARSVPPAQEHRAIAKPIPCPFCDGTGQVTVYEYAFGRAERRECKDCKGTGELLPPAADPADYQKGKTNG